MSARTGRMVFLDMVSRERRARERWTRRQYTLPQGGACIEARSAAMSGGATPGLGGPSAEGKGPTSLGAQVEVVGEGFPGGFFSCPTGGPHSELGLGRSPGRSKCGFGNRFSRFSEDSGPFRGVDGGPSWMAFLRLNASRKWFWSGLW